MHNRRIFMVRYCARLVNSRKKKRETYFKSANGCVRFNRGRQGPLDGPLKSKLLIS